MDPCPLNPYLSLAYAIPATPHPPQPALPPCAPVNMFSPVSYVRGVYFWTDRR